VLVLQSLLTPAAAAADDASNEGGLGVLLPLLVAVLSAAVGRWSASRWAGWLLLLVMGVALAWSRHAKCCTTSSTTSLCRACCTAADWAPSAMTLHSSTGRHTQSG
jgi:hypothetical protein